MRQPENLLPASEFCQHYNIEIRFLELLQEYGLVEVVTVEEDNYLDISELHEVEKMVRLHYDLNINIEGIDVINQLLHKLEETQYELVMLKNKLRKYES
jgi:chaperone modulatory protein CbpM